jgi:uncharacterized cupredoxin-like copper-binding protein
MRTLKQYAAGMATGLALALLAGAASAATVVHVDLWDKGGDMTMPTNMKYGDPGLDLSKATMGIKLDRKSAPEGVVSFKVTNSSKDTIHEMIVMYLADPSKPLPYVASEERVDEDKAGDKGEVSELDPGASGQLTIPLQPGKYLLICNVPGHYAAGMWTEFDVTK